MKRFFDLHIHPVLKTMFKENGNQLSPWKVIKVSDDLFGNALDSQSSLGMIARNSGMNLICMPIHAPETAMMKQWKILFGAYFYKEIDNSRIRKMGESKVDYCTIRKEEKKNLLQAPDAADGADLTNKKVKLLRSFDEYDPNDTDTIHVLLSVEGAHNFYGPGNNEVDSTAMVNNFEELIDEGSLVLYLTPAHLAPNALINHAFGIKIFGKKLFLPQGDGIYLRPFPPLPGKKNCYDMINLAHEQGVVIDVKHMSLKARNQFYDHHQINWPDRPIFASHVGFTGISSKQIPQYCTGMEHYNMPGFNGYKLLYNRPKGHLSGTFFNPCSVNMYDEDILEVLASGGLIGLSLDVRIMGSDGKNGEIHTSDSEYISMPELAEFNLSPMRITREVSLQINTGEIEDLEITTEEDREEQEEELAGMLELATVRNEQRHLRGFINHILHLCFLAKKYKLAVHPLTQTCIGSDFDGLIQALHCCQDVSQLPSFAKQLKEELPKCAVEARITLPDDLDQVIEGLFYTNAYNFLKSHYGKIADRSYRRLHQP